MPAVEITANDVQKLRQQTGAGMMDCKRALTTSNGDTERAAQLLREKGIAKSDKRSDRLAGEGIIEAWVAPDGKSGVLLELNCETDFVARTPEFLSISKDLISKIHANPSWNSVDHIPQDEIKAWSGKLGEKVELSRFAHYQLSGGGVIATYIHPGSRLGVMVELHAEKGNSYKEAMMELGRELALQVAGANPLYVNRDAVPTEITDKEKEIVKNQMAGQKKPPEILEKIATGKLKQYFELNCLMDQPHVRDAAGKTKIQDLVDRLAQAQGVKIDVVRFDRFRIGVS